MKVKTREDTISLRVGAIIVATGFDPYPPKQGEFGRGLPGVLTLDEFRELVAASEGSIRIDGRRVRNMAWIYCVGSRQRPDGGPQANGYCSRYCCTAAVHASIRAQAVDPSIGQYHLYRDMRTYGRNELLFEEAGRKGSAFLRWSEAGPPAVEAEGNGLVVRVRDELAGGELLEIPADLVVLVTGLGRRFYTSPAWQLGAMALVAGIVAALLLAFHGPVVTDRMALDAFAPVGWIELADWGMAAVLAGLLLVNAGRMYRLTMQGTRAPASLLAREAGTLLVHFFTQRRWRTCPESRPRWLKHLILVTGYLTMMGLVAIYLSAVRRKAKEAAAEAIDAAA